MPLLRVRYAFVAIAQGDPSPLLEVLYKGVSAAAASGTSAGAARGTA